MRKLVIGAALVAVGVVVGLGSYVGASDDGWQGRARRFSARLGGFQEVPVTSTTGWGTLAVRVVELNSAPAIEYRLTYRNLEGPATSAAHIHVGQHSVNGGVSAFLCGGGDKPPCTPRNGEFEGIIDPTDVVGPTAQGIAPGEIDELIRMMRAGLTYANVHTIPNFPGGEIRGQIADHDRGHHHGGDHDRDDD